MKCKYINLLGTALLTVTAITGPDSANTGTIVTYTATVTNSGDASGSAVVKFYVGVNLLSEKGTGTILPSGTENVPTQIDTIGWASGTYEICAKTNYEP